jgi:hypothetical protein
MSHREQLLQAVNLAQPREALERDLRTWAGLDGQEGDLLVQLQSLRFGDGGFANAETFAYELRFATGAITAIRRSSTDGFPHYSSAWMRSMEIARRDPAADFGRLRRLHAQWGGILLDSWTNPSVLLVPLPTGFWIIAGFVSIVLTATCPLTMAPGEQLKLITADAADPEMADAVLMAGMGSRRHTEM